MKIMLAAMKMVMMTVAATDHDCSYDDYHDSGYCDRDEYEGCENDDCYDDNCGW